MSKEKRYYLKNRDSILEKRKAKALADKVKKEADDLKAYELIKSKIPAINNIGVNIYETIIDDGYKKDYEEVTKLLSFKIDEKYELGGMTHLEILSDYLALNNKRFDIRHYPWKIIRDMLNYNYSTYVKDYFIIHLQVLVSELLKQILF